MRSIGKSDLTALSSLVYRADYMQLLLFLVVTCLSFSASAASTICTIKGDGIAPKAISWDMDSKKAKIKDFVGKEHEGRVTLVRPHNEGLKVNLVFEDLGKPFQDKTEYIVFSISADEHRVVGVGYKSISGVMHLDLSKGNYEARCVSL